MYINAESCFKIFVTGGAYSLDAPCLSTPLEPNTLRAQYIETAGGAIL